MWVGVGLAHCWLENLALVGSGQNATPTQISKILFQEKILYNIIR